MNITVKIEAPDICIAVYDISMAIQALAAAVAGNPGAVQRIKPPFKPEYYPAEQDLSALKPVETQTETESTVEMKTESEIETKAGPKTEPHRENKAQTDTPTYTLEQVRAKLASLTQAGKQAEVKALLSLFGVKKLTDVPPEAYPELMKEAEAIQ